MKFRFLSAAVALLVIASGVVSLPAVAQTTGSIGGTVTDSNNAPLPGASVELKSTSLQGARSAVTNAEGVYRFPSIPPGTYTVTATLSGFKKVEKTGVRVTLDAVASVPIKLEISVSQEIVVTGEAPVVDTTSNENGLNIRQDVQQKLPLTRNYAAAVQINPGVAFDTADDQHRAQNFTIYGATSIENQYLVDGVNTTGVLRGGSSKALTSEFVEELQVKAGGYEAEYGRAMGGIVNVVTKSGGNEFHGDAFGYFNRKSLTAAPKATALTDENYTDTSQENRTDFGADLGGFIVKDRIWFFGAYNRINQDIDQTQLPGTDLPNAGVTFPISFHSDLGAIKVTGRPTDTTTLVASWNDDSEIRSGAIRNLVNPNGIEPSSQNGTRKLGAPDISFSLTQLFGTVGLADIRASRHKERNVLTPDFNVYQIRDYTQDVNNPSLTNGFGSVRGFFDDNTDQRDAIKAQGSLFISNHEVKGGVDYENNQTSSTDYYSGGSRLRIYNCGSNRCPSGGFSGAVNGTQYSNVYFGHEFYTLNGDHAHVQDGYITGNTVNPHVYRIGFFGQDSWKVMPNLTVNLGVRYDQEDVRDGFGNDITNQKVVDAAGNVLEVGGSTFKLKNEWQPRVGIAWDPAKDGSTKVSAFYGRFYYALPSDLTVRSYGAKIDAITYNLDPSQTALTQSPDVARSVATQGGVSFEPFQDNLKGIYQDEFALGFEKAIDPSFSVGVRYTYRKLGRTIEDRCDFDYGYPEANGNTCVIINPGSDSPFSTGQSVHTCDGRDYIDQSANAPESSCTGPQTTNVAIPAAERKFHGVEIVLKKRVSNSLWMQASYLWSHLYGNYDGEASVGQGQAPGLGQTDPGINADYDYPHFLKYASGNLFLDRRHSFRFDGSYTAPFGLTLGIGAFLRSGAPLSEYGYFNGNYGAESNFVLPRGSVGRLPWEYEVNLALSYAIKFQPVTVTLFAQAFNLINRQYVRGQDQNCTVQPPNATPASADAVETGPGSVADCSQVTNPGSANPDYGKTIWRSDPRSLRLGARVSF